MTQWTDERIAALLTDTFAAHQRDADPDAARRIALTNPPAPRKRWTVTAAAAAAAAIALVAAITALATRDPEPGPAPAPVVPTTEGHNRALAADETARIFTAIPVPPGATKSESAPLRALKGLGVHAGPVDPSLTRTGWWVVPLSYQDLVTWYSVNSPADVSGAYTDPSAKSPVPEGDIFWQTSPDSAAYSQPTAIVSYAQLDPVTTAIRTDVTIAARYDRTAATQVPATATAIDVARSPIDGPAQSTTTTTVTDPDLLARITSAFNSLAGAMANTEPQGCGSPVEIVYAYSLTFHWEGHTLDVDPGAALCGIGLGLTRDGTELDQKLESNDALNDALEQAIHAS